MSTRLCGLCCLICILFMIPLAVDAQSAPTAALTQPDVDAFPNIETYLDVHDSAGNFVHNLKSEHVRVLENETSATITSLRELRPGVQVVIAINPGAELGIRNSQAISRYDLVKNELRSWALSRQGSTLDDLSLIITNGPGISHVSEHTEWLMTLDIDQTDARLAEPDLDTLFQAITLAADSTPRTGMGRAVLFVTPPPDAQSITTLENIFTQAQSQEIKIFVWLVASSGGLGTQGAQRLIELTESTGGQVFTYSGIEEFPDIETYLEPLRSIYRLTYLSNISISGTHQLVAQVQIEGELISTPAQSFNINIQPPKPALIAPPIEIERAPDPTSNNSEDETQPVSEYLPTEQLLQVVFDYPDERVRPIVYSALFVDGFLVDENTEPPFDLFNWNLQEYSEDGTHILLVQVEDSLGLIGSSIETPVQVSVNLQSTSNPWGSVQENMPLLIALIVLVAGAVLVLVLVLGGRLKPRTPGAIKKRRRRSDPVTQPLKVKGSPSRRLPDWVNRLQWSQRAPAPQATAFLSQISETDNLAIAPPIPITSDQVTIGMNPNQSDIVLDNPSIESLHARIIRNKEGNFRIADEGSIAGTWINYTPVSSDGTQLEHGDLIHFGRLGFRFTLREPKQVRKPTITLETIPEDRIEEPPS